jgi:two-component system, OmpR family, response regulator
MLVVLGDDLDARLASSLLSRLDQDVVIAGTVAEAEHYAAQRSWAAIILDTALSDGSGFDLLHTLVAMRFEGAIVFLSTVTQLTVRVRALEEGADDYIVRPYEPAELLARVKATMRRSRRRLGQHDSGIVRVGPVELDVHLLEVSLPGNRRERLTPSEMRLLYYLMTHTERVVAHHERSPWLFGTKAHQVSSNAVGVYMRRVRRKVEANPDQPRYILTVHGRGYRFNPVVSSQ